MIFLLAFVDGAALATVILLTVFIGDDWAAGFMPWTGAQVLAFIAWTHYS